jgi:hypothetical protein
LDGQATVPVVPRVANVTTTTFDIRAQAAKTIPASQVVSVVFQCVVVNQGVYTVATHGVKMEARRVLSGLPGRVASSANWTAENGVSSLNVTLTNTYSIPVVLGQVQTTKEWVYQVFWSRKGGAPPNAIAPPRSSTKWLLVGRNVGEASAASVRQVETLGVIVLEAGRGALPDRRCSFIAGSVAFASSGVVGATLPGATRTVSLSFLPASPLAPPLANMSVVLAQGGVSSVTAEGSFAALMGSGAVTPTSFRAVLDEDAMRDAERVHPVMETVFYLATVTP